MGFRKLEDASGELLSGQSDSLVHPLAGEEFVSNPTRSLKLLRSFRKNMRWARLNLKPLEGWLTPKFVSITRELDHGLIL
jgi:hypothetical protein